jgi:outer membrane protein TolC
MRQAHRSKVSSPHEAGAATARRGKRRLLPWCCVAILAGCVGTPPATAPVEVSVDSFAKRIWEDERLEANLAALGVSDTGTHAAELTAARLLAAALTFNPQLEVERARVDAARASVQQARERPNPSLSFNPERVIDAAAGVSPWVLAAGLVWPLRTAGKRGLAIDEALATEDTALLNAAATVWELRQNVRAALCGAEFAQAREQTARDELRLREDLGRRLEKQAEAGVISRYEASRAQLDRIAALERLNQAESDLAMSRHDLAAVAGMPIDQIESQPIGTSCLALARDHPLPDVGALSDAAIGGRLEVRAKLAEFRAADAAYRTEVARRMPDLVLGPGYSYDQGDHKITFSLTTDLPISSRNAGAIAKALSERNRVGAELEALQVDVLQSVLRARDALSASERAQASVSQLVAEADELLRRELDRKSAGEVDEPTVISARLVALSARGESLAAARGVVDAIANLEQAIEMPLTEPAFDAAAALARVARPRAESTGKE